MKIGVLVSKEIDSCVQGDLRLRVQINGEEQVVADGLILSELLKQQALQPERVAIELNRVVVPRREWPVTKLAEGDRLEIVHFVGGGCGARRQSAAATAL